ncbi:MAG: hypothetical protein KF752_08660 [Pirellulaceae bacterium]|nr:hypothetical protein [Pirellulaceae bacterium]
MPSRLNRRLFLGSTATAAVGYSELAALGAAPILAELAPLDRTELQTDARFVQFRPEIEPLVRLIETTPRERLLEEIGGRVRNGLNYQHLLTALFLAGIRNVQPRPAVGFKFHAVLVVNSAHLASLASPPADRWLPIFWSLDEFKKSQARDEVEGDWTMPAVDEPRVPTARHTESVFAQAMEQWDEPAADTAATGVARHLGANRALDLFARYVARDFRSIGHKAIYLANSWRTLQTIGWQHAEPVLRSLAYATLNHVGEPNPATSDLEPDRSWRDNQRLAETIRPDWNGGSVDAAATGQLLDALRVGSAQEAAQLSVDLLNRQISPQSIFDALHTGAAELLMRQNGIVALHAATTTNAMRFLFDHVGDDHTRRLLLLQAAAFLPQFREAMRKRGEVADLQIGQALVSTDDASGHADLPAILSSIRREPSVAAKRTAGWLAAGNDPQQLLDATRRLIFLKGNDSHDYKFSSAVLEDFSLVSPAWRNQFLAASTYSLRGSQEPDNGLIERIRTSLT